MSLKINSNLLSTKAAQRPLVMNGNIPEILPPLRVERPSRLKTLFIFSPLAGSALYFTWVRLIQSGALSRIISSASEMKVHFGYGLLNKFILSNIKFYTQALDPSNPPFFPGDVSSISACALIPIVESLRSNAPNEMQYPLITGLAAQTLGRGAIYPIYWYRFICSGAARKQKCECVGTSVPQYEAEAALLASLLGFVLPGLKMSTTKSVYWTLAWFLYPLTFSLIQRFYSRLRRRYTANHPSSEISERNSHYILLAAYAVQFLYATGLHIKVLGPRLFHPDKLKELMHLESAIPSLRTTSLTKVVYQVIQWDGVFLFTSSLVATLAFARTKTEAAIIAVTDLLLTAACGTGGALAAVWAWRECRFLKERREVARAI